MTVQPIEDPVRLATQKAEFAAARNTYLLIILSFLTICTVAVVVTTRMESEKQGFHPIETQIPMSFIDKTYMYPKQAKHPTP